MKIPFIVLSYGEFSKSHKIFSCETEGIHTLPIFFSPETASKFVPKMNAVLKEMGDDRELRTQVCNDLDQAIKMFETLSVHITDLKQVIIDPSPPNSETSDIKLIDDIKTMEEVLEELHDM